MTVQIKHEKVSDNLLTYGAKIAKYKIDHDFETNYMTMMNEYYDRPEFYLMSHIEAGKLNIFKNWSSEAINTKNTTYPLLVSKLLLGDIFALSIYDALQTINKHPELIVSYKLIHPDFSKKVENIRTGYRYEKPQMGKVY